MSARLNNLIGQLDATPCRGGGVTQTPLAPASPDDIMIVRSKRTALGRARKGCFNNTAVVDMLAPVLKDILNGVDPTMVGDLAVGSVLGNGSLRATECRMAMFLAGIPREVPVHMVNRQCSSGLQAIAQIAGAIRAGFIECGIAAGVETMSGENMAAIGKNYKIPDTVKSCTDALHCLIPMGVTSENVASKYGISRTAQDKLAVTSHNRAAAAQQKFQAEIVPVSTMWKDPNTGKTKHIIADKDDGVRAGVTMEGLGKLRAVFKKGGSTTAGNASQMTDGASACLMMKRSKAEALGLQCLGRFTGFAVVGCDPAIMGIGPAVAIPAVCQQQGLKLQDIDLWEINEAFASQATYSVEKLGLDWDVVNVNGGAIALGHPLGCTGTRMATTLLYEMGRRGSRRGVVSMCIGSGMGAAGIFERV